MVLLGSRTGLTLRYPYSLVAQHHVRGIARYLLSVYLRRPIWPLNPDSPNPIGLESHILVHVLALPGHIPSILATVRSAIDVREALQVEFLDDVFGQKQAKKQYRTEDDDEGKVLGGHGFPHVSESLWMRGVRIWILRGFPEVEKGLGRCVAPKSPVPRTVYCRLRGRCEVRCSNPYYSMVKDSCIGQSMQTRRVRALCIHSDPHVTESTPRNLSSRTPAPEMFALSYDPRVAPPQRGIGAASEAVS